jgi:hypothetical protein
MDKQTALRQAIKIGGEKIWFGVRLLIANLSVTRAS